MYTPPFKATSKIVNLIAEISGKIERYAMLLEQDASPRLSKANRIKTIHSSLVSQGKFPNIFPNNFRNQYPGVAEVVWHIASLLNNTLGASADHIGIMLGLSGHMVRTHIATLRSLGIAQHVGSNKTGYWKINRPDEKGGNR